jgi:hypothetical protein
MAAAVDSDKLRAVTRFAHLAVEFCVLGTGHVLDNGQYRCVPFVRQASADQHPALAYVRKSAASHSSSNRDTTEHFIVLCEASKRSDDAADVSAGFAVQLRSEQATRAVWDADTVRGADTPPIVRSVPHHAVLVVFEPSPMQIRGEPTVKGGQLEQTRQPEACALAFCQLHCLASAS